MDTPYANPAEHAQDFSRRYAEELEVMSGQIMLDLGLRNDQMGERDPARNLEHHCFFPDDRQGGTVSHVGQVTLDSGLINPELLAAAYHQDVVDRWKRTRLKDRAQAIIAHELAEHEYGDHELALIAAPETSLPISHAARELSRAMEAGWKGYGR